MATKILPRLELQILDRFTRNLRQEFGDNLVLVKLYGSKARGDWQDESDIDIFIVVEDKTRRIERIIRDFAVRISIKFEKTISVITYSYDEYLDATHPPSLLLHQDLRSFHFAPVCRQTKPDTESIL